MFEARRKSTVLRQALGLSGNNAAPRREPGSPDFGYQFPKKVFHATFTMCCMFSFSPSDMNHSNMYVVGLGLCTFANIASEEMSRDLANEIEKLLGSSNTYIRKKVCIVQYLYNPPH